MNAMQLVAQEITRQWSRPESLTNTIREKSAVSTLMVVEGLLCEGGEGCIGKFPGDFPNDEAGNLIALPLKEKMIVAASLLIQEIDKQ